jgi:molybdopterin-biosynthesis enzyme MoeA-like protein
VLIGNEILSGKIRDENGSYLLRELRALGVEMRRMEVVPDEEELIIDAVRRCRAASVHLFTSGGIGATHDDVTVPAIARALERPLVHDPTLVGMLQARYGDRLDAVHLRLAEVPEGAELLWGMHHELRFPAILADGVLILPGVPLLFAEKFEAVKERYRAPAIALRSLYLSSDEPDIAELLTTATTRFPGVSIGSYPRFDPCDYRVKVTVESRDAALVDTCTTWLRENLGSAVLRDADQ